MGLTTNHYDPVVDGIVVMKNGTKVVAKKKLAEGKQKLGKVKAPAKIAVGIKAFIKDKKSKDKHNLVIDRFEATWYIDIDTAGKSRLLGPAIIKSKEAPFSTIKAVAFDTNSSVGIRLKIISDPPVFETKKFMKFFECSYEIEQMNEKEKLEKFKASRVTCVSCAIGAYPVGKPETKNTKKHKSNLDWSGFKKWFHNLPHRTQSMITNDLRPGGKKIEILGYADNQGGRAENDKLGQARAENVRDWIITWSGTSTKSLFACKGKGEGPKGNDKKGEEKDNPERRRVTVMIMAEK